MMSFLIPVFLPVWEILSLSVIAVVGTLTLVRLSLGAPRVLEFMGMAFRVFLVHIPIMERSLGSVSSIQL